MRVTYHKKDGKYEHEKKRPWYVQFDYYRLPAFSYFYILTPFGGFKVDY